MPGSKKSRVMASLFPEALQGTMAFPGLTGGQEWGGPAFDPETGLLYVNTNEMPWIVTIAKRPQMPADVTGKSLYQANCAQCHKQDRAWHAAGLSVSDWVLTFTTTAREISQIVRGEDGRMPVHFRASKAIRKSRQLQPTCSGGRMT